MFLLNRKNIVISSLILSTCLSSCSFKKNESVKNTIEIVANTTSATTMNSTVLSDASKNTETIATNKNSNASNTESSSKTSNSMVSWISSVADNKSNSENVDAEETTKFYLGNTVNAGKDNGFKNTDKIISKDIHFGWNLGKFFITGYTRSSEEGFESPIFLKNVGDKVQLWFHLEQNIDALNGNPNLTIEEDKNGSDEYFGVPKTDFGKGALIIRKIDYQNNYETLIIYTDFIRANNLPNSDIKVELFEEGDYEVALDYEIKEVRLNVFGVKLAPLYHNYRNFFKFSVRNGNTMVFPFDVVTKSELNNTSVTPNGFYLDLARSRYLDIDIKKEVLKEGSYGLVEDVRFNRPAKDGDMYTDEGLYTISVKNRYTNQETKKIIYVGKDKLLTSHVVTGIPINEIKKKLDNGFVINDNGYLVSVQGNKTVPSINSNTLMGMGTSSNTESESINVVETDNSEKGGTGLMLPILFILAIALIGIYVFNRSRNKNESVNVELGKREKEDEKEL